MLVVFEKGERLRHIGHLDLMRAMQRALRRSGLPVRYSQGFNPHIILSLAAPLAVGMAGLSEVMEVPLQQPVAEKAFRDSLNAVLPPDLRCLAARAVDDTHPAPMAALFAAQYALAPVGEKEAAAALLEAVPGFMAQPAIMALRKTKRGEAMADIRPLIFNLQVKDGALQALLSLNEQGTCKPDLLLDALCAYAGVPKPRCRIARLRLYNKLMVPLENG